MLCAVGIGAYDSSAIDINCGGYGASDSSGVGSWGGHTAAAPSYPFGVDGTLTEVKLRFRGGTDVPTSCILKILYGANPVYSQRGSDVSILTDAVAAYAGDGVRYTVEATGLSIPVQAGDFLAVYISGNLNMHEVDVTGDFYVYHDAGNVTTLSMASSTPSELIGSCTIETDEYIIYDGSTGWLGTNTIPLATPDTEPYYIVLENVQVPDTESMTIALDYTNTSTGENTTEELYTIDYSGGANDGYIYDTDDSTRWEPIKGQKGSGIDYYIYVTTKI